MPSVTITHATQYQYGTEVSLGPHRLMLRPRETRDLILTSFDLEISPEARIDWSHDVAGNAVATAQFDTNTTMLSHPVVRARGPARSGLAGLPDCRRRGLVPFRVFTRRLDRSRRPGRAAICGRHRAAVAVGRAFCHGTANGHAFAAERHRQRHHGRDFLPEPRDGGHAGAAGDPRQGMGIVPGFRRVVRGSRSNAWLRGQACIRISVQSLRKRDWIGWTPVPRTPGSRSSFPERAGSRSTRPTDRSAPAISFPSPSRGGSSRLRRSAEVSMGDRQTSCRWK
jgi:hypothetical protein